MGSYICNRSDYAIAWWDDVDVFSGNFSVEGGSNHARTFPDLLIRDLSLSFYKQVKEKPSISQFYYSSVSSCMQQTNLAIWKGSRILHSEESRTIVLKPYMFCILKQQNNAIFNVSCSFEKTIISINAFRFGNSNHLNLKNIRERQDRLALRSDGFYWIIIYTILLLVSQTLPYTHSTLLSPKLDYTSESSTALQELKWRLPQTRCCYRTRWIHSGPPPTRQVHHCRRKNRNWNQSFR